MGRLGFFSLLMSSILILATACSGKKDDKVSQKFTCKDGEIHMVGIVGGQVVTSPSSPLASKTVFLISKTGERDKDGSELMEMCTGSLVDRNIVLTAGHCVPDSLAAGDISVAFSLDPVCQVVAEGEEVALRKTEKIIRHSGYQVPSQSDSASDIAMLRFSGVAPAGKTSSQLLLNHEVDLTAQSEIILVGYGQTTDYNQADSKGAILRTAQISPMLNPKVPAKKTNSNRAPVLYFDQSHGQGGCAGDSGGPTYLKLDDQLLQIGINSAVDALAGEFVEQSDVTCKIGLRSVSVFAQKDWILQTYNSLRTNLSKGLLVQ